MTYVQCTCKDFDLHSGCFNTFQMIDLIQCVDPCPKWQFGGFPDLLSNSGYRKELLWNEPTESYLRDSYELARSYFAWGNLFNTEGLFNKMWYEFKVHKRYIIFSRNRHLPILLILVFVLNKSFSFIYLFVGPTAVYFSPHCKYTLEKAHYCLLPFGIITDVIVIQLIWWLRMYIKVVNKEMRQWAIWEPCCPNKHIYHRSDIYSTRRQQIYQAFWFPINNTYTALPHTNTLSYHYAHDDWWEISTQK